MSFQLISEFATQLLEFNCTKNISTKNETLRQNSNNSRTKIFSKLFNKNLRLREAKPLSKNMLKYVSQKKQRRVFLYFYIFSIRGLIL